MCLGFNILIELGNFLNEQMLCSSSQDTLFCAKCSLTEQQLQFTLTELKSAQVIIALLREDIRHANLSSNTEMTSSP